MAMSNPPFFGQRSPGAEDEDDPVVDLARNVRAGDPFEGIFRARSARTEDLRSLSATPGPRSDEPVPRVRSRSDEDDDPYAYEGRHSGHRADDHDDPAYDDPRHVSWDRGRDDRAWDGHDQPRAAQSQRYVDDPDYDDGHDDQLQPTAGHRSALRIGERIEEPQPQRSGLASLFGKKKAAEPAPPVQQDWHEDDDGYDDHDRHARRHDDDYDDHEDPRYAGRHDPRAVAAHADDEDYDDDDDYPYDDEDDEPAAPRRRGGGMVVTAVIALGVVGAGAFGYWQLTSPAMTDGLAVINADTAPTKTIPMSAPEEPQQAVRERFTETTQESPQVPPGGQAEAASPLQPKLVKTYSVRPEGNFVEDKPGLIPDAAQPFAGVERSAALQTATPTALSNFPIPAGTWMVQVLAGKSEDEARAGYETLQQEHPGILGGKAAHIQKVAKVYRVRLPMEDKESAVQLCTNLKAKSVDCLVRNN